MTSRERMLRTIEFNRPDRVPRDLWTIPAAHFKHGEQTIRDFKARWPIDITQASVGRCPAKRARGQSAEVGTYTDEWGCVYQNLERGIHGEVKEPLVDDWSHLDRVQPPTEWLTVDIEAVNAFCRGTNLFTFASGWARLFERMQFLRGTENLMMDFAEEPPELAELIRIVHEFYLKQYEVWARTECDALVMMDDWGSQQALLISPAQWRRMFKPLYAQYTKVAHDAGKKFFMHSDGVIFDIYEDLIEIGVDAINSQLFCMNIEEIGRRFAGRITFWGEIDRQHVLPFGTPQDVRNAVRRVADNLYRPEGGVIAQFELSRDTPLVNADAAFQEWEKASRVTGEG